MATKAELEQTIMDLRSSLEQAKRDAEYYKNYTRDLIDNHSKAIEDGIYNAFKEQNEVFLSRFIREWCEDHLCVEIL